MGSKSKGGTVKPATTANTEQSTSQSAEKKLICVECAHPVPELYNNTSSPGNIKLTICERCNSFADKYVEYDIVLIALDLLLHRIGVYRHILYNVARDTSDFATGYKRLLVGVLIFSSYAKLYILTPFDPMANLEVNLSICATTLLEIVCLMFSISVMCMIYRRNFSRQVITDVIELVSLCLFPHLFYILVIIWRYPPHFMAIIHLFSLTSTSAALMAYLEVGVLAPIFVAIATGLNFALFLGLTHFGIPSVHFLASTGLVSTLQGVVSQVVQI